jgi:hypothetical protein
MFDLTSLISDHAGLICDLAGLISDHVHENNYSK